MGAWLVIYEDILVFFFFFFQAEDGIRDSSVTGVQTCALPIYRQLGNIWEQLEKEPLLDSRLRAGACLELHGCRSSAWFRRWHVPIAAERSWRVRRYRARPNRECGEVDATSRAQTPPPFQPASPPV